jgi:hypothetical protein
MESKKLDEMKIEIKDALTCYICTGKVSDPMMCPKCKKLVCSQCIKKWLDDHQKCPFCQTQETFNDFILLPFMNHLSNYFIEKIDKNDEEEEEKKEKKKKNQNVIIDEDEEGEIEDNSNSNINSKEKPLSKTQLIPNKLNINEEDKDININNNQMSSIKRGEICPKHKTEVIEFYCLNCNTKHCPKCLMIISEESKIHKDHKIISIEQKKKFNLDEVKEEINNLSNVVVELNSYKKNLDVVHKLVETKEEFIKKVLDEFKEFYSKRSQNKLFDVDLKNQLLKNQLDRINNARSKHNETLNKFVENDDLIGFEGYKKEITEYKNTNRYYYPKQYDINLNPKINFYETDFIAMDINEYNEIIGESQFAIQGFEKVLNFRLNGEAIDEVLLNLQFETDKKEDAKDRYFGFLMFQSNDNSITTIGLDEKMEHNEILILGRTIVKSGLKSIVDKDKKCHFKLILAIFDV